ncbi:MAG: tetratricopeptide repeat protein, partial [Verrucomicrobiia bacterium]
MGTSLSPTIARRRLPFAAKLVLSILPCIIVLGAVEAVLRLTGCGYPAEFFLSTEHAGQKALIENTRFAWRFMPQQTARAPLSFQFPEEKPANHFRIFVFGESAAMGDPEPAFGFSRILEVLLQERYPSLRFEVINTAFPAINSHVIREIARDCADCGADVWIVYAGNNEVIGPFGATPAFGSSAPPIQVVRVASFLSRFRIGQCLGGFARELRTRQPANSAEMTELLLSRPVVDTDPVLQRIYANFENNLHAIVRLGLHARARIILNTMVSNLKDCAPFIEGDPPPLPPERMAVWQTSLAEGTRLFEEGNTEMALARFQQASALATNHAGLQFRLGRAFLATGDTNAAMSHLQAARDMDAFRARADSRINGIIKRVSQRYPHERVNLIDAEQAFNTSSPYGITGAEFMCDHVHFRFSGNYLLARLQANAISKFIPHQTESLAEWLDQEACARRLGFTDWNRYRFATALRRQISGNLFRRQINHREQDARLQNEIQSLLNANKPDAMPQQLAIYREAVAAMPHDWVLQDQLG